MLNGVCVRARRNKPAETTTSYVVFGLIAVLNGMGLYINKPTEPKKTNIVPGIYFHPLFLSFTFILC